MAIYCRIEIAKLGRGILEDIVRWFRALDKRGRGLEDAIWRGRFGVSMRDVGRRGLGHNSNGKEERGRVGDSTKGAFGETKIRSGNPQ